MNLAAFSTYDALVGIWVTLVGNVAYHKPLTVRTPFIVESSVLAIPLAAVCYLRHLLGLQVHHLKFDAVLYEGQLLAVRTVFGTLPFHLRKVGLAIQFQLRQFWEDAFLLNKCGISKIQVFIPYYAGSIELPVTIAFRGVNDGSSVRSKVYTGLSASRLSDSAGGGIFHAGNKHFASDYEGNLFAVLADNRLACSARECQVGDYRLIVACKRNVQFLRLSVRLLRIYFSVIGIAEQAVLGYTQETNGMCLKAGNSLGVCCFGGSSLSRTTIHIHAAPIAFAQEVERLTIGTYHRITVFACVLCHVGMLLICSIIEPYISCNGRGMMFAPLILVALAILVIEALAVWGEANHLSWRSQHL